MRTLLKLLGLSIILVIISYILYGEDSQEIEFSETETVHDPSVNNFDNYDQILDSLKGLPKDTTIGSLGKHIIEVEVVK
jgi:hypothetical protein